MKLDVWKAFERLEWPFLFAIIQKSGMGGMLSSFLKASLHTASSLIILNGRTTQAFRLTRSVPQGCPLSPFLFILAFDSLSHMLNQAVSRRDIVGVEFRDLGLATLHSMFADNLTLIIRATMIYIRYCQRLLKVFGIVSGLHCLWEQTSAMFIPAGPPPAEFFLLPWHSEEDSNASPVLGIPMAANFAVSVMETQLLEKVETKTAKMKDRHLSLAARITIANGLILSTLWYYLTLWAGDFAFFSKLQKLIEGFVCRTSPG